MKNKILPFFAIFCIFLLYLASQVFQIFSSKTLFIFCDVGEGDGAILIHKSTVILIDAGRDSRMGRCLARHLPFWQKQIFGVILTHPDADHIGGLKNVMKSYSVKYLFSNFSPNKTGQFREIYDALVNSGVIEKSFMEGEEIRIKENNLKFEIFNLKSKNENFNGKNDKIIIRILSLWPREKHKESEKTNLYSNISAVMIGESRFLMLGDSEISTQLSVLSSQLSEFSLSVVGQPVSKKTDKLKTDKPDADLPRGKAGNRKLRTDNRILVIKVSHHGSTKNFSPTLLRALAPKYAIISVGKNKYGHPGKKVIDGITNLEFRVQNLELGKEKIDKIQILRTDEMGDIVFECENVCKLKE